MHFTKESRQILFSIASAAVENSFITLFPRDRKPDTINPGPPGFDDIMADNWSFRYLSNTRDQEREREREKEGGKDGHRGGGVVTSEITRRNLASTNP